MDCRVKPGNDRGIVRQLHKNAPWSCGTLRATEPPLTVAGDGRSLVQSLVTQRRPMHRYVVPEAVKERLLRRQGKLISHDTIDAARTALVVVDMQNFFVAKGFPLEVVLARAIVPNINRMAKAMRAAGAAVAWVQTSAA